MQTNVDALVILNVNFGFRLPSVVAVRLRPHYVLCLACWHALCKLSFMIGIELPVGLFLIGAADLHPHSVCRTFVWSVDRAENERVRLLGMLVGRKGSRSGGQQRQAQQTESRYPVLRTSHRPHPLL